MIFFARSDLTQIQVVLISVISILVFYGAVILYFVEAPDFPVLATKHLICYFIGFIVGYISLLINHRVIYSMAYIGYFASLLLLVGVELVGIKAMGGKRWLGVASFRFQPSELVKIALVLGLARYLSALGATKITSVIRIIPAILMVIIPAGLIIKQPDLGTGMIILMVSGIMFFAAGIRIWKFVLVILVLCIAMPTIWNKLHDYQQKRILVFLNPGEDSLGKGYNILQSIIAVGSGGIFGKGLGHGTQSHLEFLPEHQTDFIFATLAEEVGFVGSFFLIMLYTIVVFINMLMSFRVKNTFAQLTIVGINAIFICHVFVNIGMVTGIVPVVGVPLPLISAGGASLLSMLIGFSIILNLYSYRRIR